MKQGLLLFAHGARDARWALPFEEVARRIGERAPDSAIALAYLELMRPDISEAAERLVRSGCTRIDVLPLFLGAGGHVRDDLPRQLERLRAAHPAVLWRLQPPIGELECVIQAMTDAALELLRNNSRA